MRQDIHIDTAAGDIVWKETNYTNVRRVELEEMDAYVLCTIFIPASFDIRRLQTVGAIAKIPYTPIEKPLKIRFARIYGNNNRFIANPNTGDDIFDCVVSRHSGLNVSQLFEVNEDFMFNVVIDGGTAVLYSADDLDFEQIEANIQNRNLLLRCVPGNYYRYPASGVGMILYLNSNISTTDLARVLQAEFSEEKTVVRNAYYDDDTKKLVLDLDFSEANGSV